MNMVGKVDRTVEPKRKDPARFGAGVRVDRQSAINIADVVRPHLRQARDNVTQVTDHNKLSQIVWEECGREIRGFRNLLLIEMIIRGI